jgi:hypothetical protein
VVTDAAADTSACASGSVQHQTCGKCGTQSRVCLGGAWLDWGACGAETGACVPGDTQSGACGFCGTRTATCTSSCVWSYGACSGEGGCQTGATETQYGACLDASQVKTRACGAACAWGAWSECH